MDELIGGLSSRGYPVVRVNFPRSYVDVNREPYELDPRMFSGRLPSFANTRSTVTQSYIPISAARITKFREATVLKSFHKSRGLCAIH